MSASIHSHRSRGWAGLLGFGAVAAAVAALGSLATNRSVNSEWFQGLEKPWFYPPPAAFGVVWTLLYAAIAVAGWLAWRSGGGAPLVPWSLQLLLNLGWSLLFFGWRSPGWALAEIVLLLAAVSWTLMVFWRADRRAGLLLVPYLAWVGFAAVLNLAIVVLNPA